MIISEGKVFLLSEVEKAKGDKPTLAERSAFLGGETGDKEWSMNLYSLSIFSLRIS